MFNVVCSMFNVLSSKLFVQDCLFNVRGYILEGWGWDLGELTRKIEKRMWLLENRGGDLFYRVWLLENLVRARGNLCYAR